MAEYIAQMTLNMDTNVSADAVVNTLYFVGPGSPTDLSTVETAMFSLYDDLNTVYSSDVAQTGHVLKIYDRLAPTPRIPLVEVAYAFPTNPLSDPLPHEVAICLSFQGDRVSGVPQARQRGRIYIGPVDAAAVTAAGYVSSTYYNLVKDAGDALLTFSGTNGVSWAVYSRVDNASTIVTNGWVDDAFDTQRRRGRVATSRVLFP